MGAAWRGPKERDLEPVLEMVREVKALGLETCCTLGMLKDGQAERLKAAGLDYYNHNLDTAPEFYGDVITTRDYQDRLDTLDRVRAAGIEVCCGGIVGMGESAAQRAGLIAQLANIDPYPESVPINHLVQVEGTPLHERLGGDDALDPFEFVRTIAVARITMPKAMVRLSAGRRELGDAVQALCFPRRRQLGLLRRQAADDRQSGRRRRPRAVRQARTDRDGRAFRLMPAACRRT